MNRSRGFVLAILSLAATAGVPVLVLLVRLRVITFTDDFTGFNAVGFVLSWSLVLLLTGTVFGGLAWHADRRSWLARSVFGLNALLLLAVLWSLMTMG